MEAFLDWIINRGGALGIVCVAGPLLGFYLSQAMGRIKTLEENWRQVFDSEDDRKRLVTIADLKAAFATFELTMTKNLSHSYVPREEYDRRQAETENRVNTTNSRLERHEQWHFKAGGGGL